MPILLMLITAAVGIGLLTRTRFGLYVRAVGNSGRSAEESGLPIKRVTMTTYILAAITATLGALILIARVGGLQSGIGIGLEFTVIAAVILGGTKLSGGSGSVAGSVIGAVFLVLIDNGLNMLNASPYIYDTVRGGVLLAAVIVDRISDVRQKRHVQKQTALRIRRAV